MRTKLWMLSVVVLALLLSSVSPALTAPDNDAGNPPGLAPGVEGYRVFGKDARKSVVVSFLTVDGFEANSQLLSTIYRSGWSDCFESSATIYGNHNSGSDLYEDSILARGGIKKSGTGWLTTAEQQRQGMSAFVVTSWPDPQFIQTWIAGTRHEFHTDGYVDAKFDTQDEYVG